MRPGTIIIEAVNNAPVVADLLLRFGKVVEVKVKIHLGAAVS